MKKSAVAVKKPVAGSKNGKATKDAPARRFAALSATLGRRDDADAFLRMRNGRRTFTKVELAEDMAEGFVGSATAGGDMRLETRDSVQDEERGGPFVTTPARREFAEGTDPSNPEDAEREPFPHATSHGDEDAEFEA